MFCGWQFSETKKTFRAGETPAAILKRVGTVAYTGGGQAVEAPLVIDTTEPEVLEVALEAAPGRIIVNAVNMENGRQRLDAMLPLIRDYGAATIALTIDEQGMARTADRKLETARKIYDIATREYGLLPDALIW